MSDQTQEKENSLAELMVRILKEPLKPLCDSVECLKGELADIKGEIEHTSSTVTDALKQSERAAKRRDEETLDTLRTSLTEQAQAQAQALAAMPGHLDEVLASTVTSLQVRLHEQQASLADTLAQWQTSAAAANAEQAASINTAVSSISQRLEQQQNSAQAARLAVLGALENAAEHSQSAMAKTQLDVQALCEAVAAGQAEVLFALSQQFETLNARLEKSQGKARRLTVAIGVLFVSTLAYVAYDLLGRP